MVNKGAEIRITLSDDLAELGLEELVGEKAVVVEDLNYTERTHKGFMVRLCDRDYLGEDTWFIPACSAGYA